MSATEIKSRLRLGTRGSLLARSQSGMIADEMMRRHPGLLVELVILKTTGDVIIDRPLHDVGGKGLFTKELEQALLAEQIDFAVHSLKDVPVTMPLVLQDNLIIASVPEREDARDALASAFKRLGDLPTGARIGTGSLRRQCQILSLRPDVSVLPVRGNVDTRLRRLHEGQYDAVILAVSGLRRSGLYRADLMTAINFDECLPAAGQGALALQCRKNDSATRQLLAELNDPMTALCVEAERAIVSGLAGDCHSPIAALANVMDNTLRLRTAVGGYGGMPPVLRAEALGPLADPDVVVAKVIAELFDKGAASLLAIPAPK